MANPNDEVRGQILRYFYDRNATATSRFGKKGSAAKISDVKRELKERHGLTQPQVVSNLTYLIDRKWVNTVEVEKTVTVGGGTVPSTVTWYEIAAAGIDKIEGESEFTPPDRYPGINVQATGNNVITVGDGNIVNAEYTQLFAELNELKNAVASSDALGEAEKLDISIDIETLKDQLAKVEPDRQVTSRLWSRIEKAAAVAGLTEFVLAVTPLIQGIVT